MRCGCGFHGYAIWALAERRREGRKQGGELEWARVPVFGLHGWNFKHVYCSSTCLGPKLRCVAFWGGAGIKAVSHEFISVFRRWRCWEPACFCSVCRFPLPVDFWDGGFLTWLVGAKVKETWRLKWRVNILLHHVISREWPSNSDRPLFNGICQISVEKLILVLWINKQLSSVLEPVYDVLISHPTCCHWLLRLGGGGRLPP